MPVAAEVTLTAIERWRLETWASARSLLRCAPVPFGLSARAGAGLSGGGSARAGRPCPPTAPAVFKRRPRRWSTHHSALHQNRRPRSFCNGGEAARSTGETAEQVGGPAARGRGRSRRQRWRVPRRHPYRVVLLPVRVRRYDRPFRDPERPDRDAPDPTRGHSRRGAGAAGGASLRHRRGVALVSCPRR